MEHNISLKRYIYTPKELNNGDCKNYRRNNWLKRYIKYVWTRWQDFRKYLGYEEIPYWNRPGDVRRLKKRARKMNIWDKIILFLRIFK